MRPHFGGTKYEELAAVTLLSSLSGDSVFALIPSLVLLIFGITHIPTLVPLSLSSFFLFPSLVLFVFSLFVLIFGMGVKGLWRILDPVARPITSPEALAGQRVAIDASIWIYQFMRALPSDPSGSAEQSLILAGLFRRVCKLLYFNIRPILVFDGTTPALKRQTVRERAERQSATQERHKRIARKLVAAQAHLQRLNRMGRARNGKRAAAKGQEEKGEDTFEALGDTTRNDEHFLNEQNKPPGLKSEEEEEEERESERELDEEYLAQLDISSPDFGRLPVAIQQEILLAKKEYILRQHLGEVRTGQTRQEVLQATEALQFSHLQVDALVKRRKVTSQLERLNEGVIVDYEGEHAWPGKPRNIMERRIATDPTKRYILVKNHRGGWTMGGEQVERGIAQEISPLSALTGERQYPKRGKEDASAEEDDLLFGKKLPNGPPKEKDEEEEDPVLVSLANRSQSSRTEKEILSFDPETYLLETPSIYHTAENGNKEEQGTKIEQCSPSPSEETVMNQTQRSLDAKDEGTRMRESLISLSASILLPSPSSPLQSKLTHDNVPPLSVADQGKIVAFKKESSQSDQPSLEPSKASVISSAPLSLSSLSESESESESKPKSESELEEEESPIIEELLPFDDSRAQLIERLQGEVESLRAESKSSHGTNLDGELLEDFRSLLTLMGIPWMVAPGEAEAQCAYLQRTGQVEAVISDDNDTLVYGATRVYRYFFNQEQHIRLYLARDAERELGLTIDRLILLAILLGSDYGVGVRGVGPVKAIQLVRAISRGGPSLDKCLDIIIAGLAHGKWPEHIEGEDRKILARLSIHCAISEVSLSRAPQVIDQYQRPLLDETTDNNFCWQHALSDLTRLYAFLQSKLHWSLEECRKTIDPIITRRLATSESNHRGSLSLASKRVT